jgi:hypothetical protein
MESEAGVIPMRAFCVLLAAATLLAACGRVGPIRPPGPPEQVTYPRVYPAR